MREKGPSCSSVKQAPDAKVTHVRFVERALGEPEGGTEAAAGTFPRPEDILVQTASLSTNSRSALAKSLTSASIRWTIAGPLSKVSVRLLN